MAGPRARRFLWAAAGVIWLGVITVGLRALMIYDTAPGAPADAPLAWPTETRLVRATDAPTLVMLAHPRCDCTRASLNELAELLARAKARPRTYVVFIKPARTGREWEQTPVMQIASAIQGVTIVRDDFSREARRFGAETSGQVLMFAGDGRLVFSGGATGARGKTGTNVGRTSLLSILNSEAPGSTLTPVFGCPLFGPGDATDDDASGDHAHER